jgi:hypothetical protein
MLAIVLPLVIWGFVSNRHEKIEVTPGVIRTVPSVLLRSLVANFVGAASDLAK